MEKYRVQEISGTKQFVVQKRILVKEKLDESTWSNRIWIRFFMAGENENEYVWADLNKIGTFSPIYQTMFFSSFEEAKEVAEKLKAQGEIVYHNV